MLFRSKLETLIFTFPVQKDTETRLTFGGSFEEELEFLYFTVGVDGIFTDYCDDVSRFLSNRVQTQQSDDDNATLFPPTTPAVTAPENLTSPLDMEN